jgi:glycine/D-amino acid oxidase-like deaminating enzyme
MQRRLGVDVQLVSPQELHEIEPDWCVDDFDLAAYEPGSGYGDGAAVAQDFMGGAREHGVTFLGDTRVTAICAAGGPVQGVVTDKGRIDAPIVVLTAGPWTRPLLRTVGADVPVENEYHEVAIVKNPPGMRGCGCACIDSITTTYFRSEGGGFTLVGDFYGKRGADPDDFPQSATGDSIAGLVGRMAKRVPRIEEGGIARSITGVYDMSPDARPLLGEMPGISGLHVAVGFSGMGFKISPAVGVVMAELITEGRARTVDIEAFRPGRFAEGRPIKAEFEYADD